MSDNALSIARAARIKAMHAYQDARAAADAARRSLDAAEQKARQAYAAWGKADDAYKRQEHLADGFCSKMLRVGDTWSRHDEPCRRKAKIDGLCGIHANAAKKRAERRSA